MAYAVPPGQCLNIAALMSSRSPSPSSIMVRAAHFGRTHSALCFRDSPLARGRLVSASPLGRVHLLPLAFALNSPPGATPSACPFSLCVAAHFPHGDYSFYKVHREPLSECQF